MSFNTLPQKTVLALSPLLLLLGKHEKVFGCLYPYIILLLYFTIVLYSGSSPIVEASLVSTEGPLDFGVLNRHTLCVRQWSVHQWSVHQWSVHQWSMHQWSFVNSYNHEVCLIVIIYLHLSPIFSLTDSYYWVHEFLISRLILWSP